MRRGVALLVIAVSGTAAAAPVRTSQSDPHPGIHREHWVDSTVPARIDLVRVDLTSAEIALYATKESDKGLTTSGFASRLGAQVAINGDAFAVAGYTPRGLAIGDSTPWTNTADTALLPLFHLRRVGERTMAAIAPPEETNTTASLPAGTQGAVSGRPLLVRIGSVAQIDCNDPVTLACSRAPRSAVAVSADGNTLWLVTVDGWQSGSIGLSAEELATFLVGRGAYMAMALDGGSSSTLVLDGNVISSPSDGIQRTVANHIAVKYGALPAGELVGLICKTSVFQCGNNTALRLSNAQVTLDDGRVQTTDTTGTYDFTGLTPRLACVTVRKTGYKTKHQCQTVDSGIQTYNSVLLEPGTDPPPDAGVPEDAFVPDDSTVGGDGGFGERDGPASDPGPGCCDAGRDHPPFVLVVLVGWMLTRRRGTKA
jgi:hypothetical protein